MPSSWGESLYQCARAARRRWWGAKLTWRDFADLALSFPRVDSIAGDPLARLGIYEDQFATVESPVKFQGMSRYLGGVRSVVTHSVDDTTVALPACLDAMDRHGIKATLFIVTDSSALLSRLWPRLSQAVADGHEIGSHSRRHPCRVPESFLFCLGHFTNDEIEGSRDDILGNTVQPHVWSWAYPCGNCAGRQFVRRKVARAGYVVARAYPDEFNDRHLVPDLQGYDSNPYAARYTQVVQKAYPKRDGSGAEIQISGRTDVATLNTKFDEVSESGGIYSFVSHPQMLDYGPDGFYERHLAHIGGREDVWYVPMGPLYAYRTLSDQTVVRQLKPNDDGTKFAVFNSLDPGIYNGSVTLEFEAPAPVRVFAGGRVLPERRSGSLVSWKDEHVRRTGRNLFVTVRPNAVLEFK